MTLSPHRVTALFLASLALAGAPGCDPGEAVDPVPAPTATTAPTAAPDPDPTGIPPKRTVFLRDPLGGPANNLLVDGDFELSVSAGGGQYGWRMFDASGTGEIAMTAETGGLCRSGLTCVRLEKGRVIFGRGTAAPGGKGHVMGMYARLPEGAACKRVELIAVDCDTFSAYKKAVADPEPEAGWCHYRGTFGAANGAVCLYVQSTLGDGEVALVDAAVLAPNDGTVPYKLAPGGALDRATLATMARLADTLRRTRPFGRPAVTAAPPPRL